ncbi:putative glutathione-specific gamma-glutamylcyclotransferase 2 [Anopheles bellator]|uniref:putative glutathione-specific gamma-glutamylcyclotransferase 2 n=1 Tax=Anopheles bellator TaxID=139047 RepID=UPI00264861EF|nr:putative glutathione-specific gamma-glutamylcyclotransferase 2 [Anopheles bellator]
MEHDSGQEQEDIWIFAFGSLLWKADSLLPYLEKQKGFVKGFQRRFFRSSVLHRGTPENPGRVVTLIYSGNPECKVYGVGYRIAVQDKHHVLEMLRCRETVGYERYRVEFYTYPSDSQQPNDPLPIQLFAVAADQLTFVGKDDTLETIAEQILGAAGESGTNPAYVYRLADAMRQLFPGEQDDHLFDLEKLLLSRDPQGEEYTKQ